MRDLRVMSPTELPDCSTPRRGGKPVDGWGDSQGALQRGGSVVAVRVEYGFVGRGSLRWLPHIAGATGHDELRSGKSLALGIS